SLMREPSGPKDYQTLDHPYEGLVMEVVDAHEGTDRAQLDDWVRTKYLPWLHRSPNNPIGATVWFAPQPLPGDKQPDVADVPGVDRRLTLLHFLECDPRDCWTSLFANNGGRIEAGGVGSMQLSAPFIPVIFGTDAYVDELRDDSNER